MRELIVSLVLIALGASTNLYANDQCTNWVKERSVSCIFAGSSADVFKRECDNHCWWNQRTRRGNMGPDCNRQRVCFDGNPVSLGDGCSNWVKQRGTTCYSQEEDSWEQKWVRVCTKGFDESRCSKRRPTR